MVVKYLEITFVHKRDVHNSIPVLQSEHCNKTETNTALSTYILYIIYIVYNVYIVYIICNVYIIYNVYNVYIVYII